MHYKVPGERLKFSEADVKAMFRLRKMFNRTTISFRQFIQSLGLEVVR